MLQAVILATIFEFGGGLLLGRVSTSVIATGVADIASFQDNPQGPQSFAYGMMLALAVGGLWQLWASYAGYNVSATQSIIGGIVGFAVVWEGFGAVKWADPDPDSFPPYSGVLPIILSWVIAPVITAAAAALIFLVCRTFILRAANPVKRSYVVLPFAVFITLFVNVYFVLTKGAKKMISKNDDSWTDAKALQVAAITAACAAGLSAIVGIPLMMRAIKRTNFDAPSVINAVGDKSTPVVDDEGGRGAGAAAPAGSIGAATAAADTGTSVGSVDSAGLRKPPRWRSLLNDAKLQLKKGTQYDIHAVVETDPLVAAIHANAEIFDVRAEKVFSYLQVFSAICVIFAHGAGEVGYMAGPLTQIVYIVQDGYVSDEKFEPLMWVLCLSAGGLVLGLSTYGYNVMQAMGTSLAKLTPSRGFAAELATGLIILLSSQYGLPTSSSQCITGGIMGVGALEGAAGVNWRYIFKQLLTWIGTLVVVSLTVAALFANAMYTPSKLCDVQGVPPPEGA